MRGFVLGLVMVVAVVAIVLSVRPRGLRRQLRLMGRRLKILLWLGGIYVVGSMIIRFAFPPGPASDFGPPALALILLASFFIAGQDPRNSRAP